MITRDEAIMVCYELMESGILAQDLEEALQSIASCIEAEQIGRHEWGVDDAELGILYVTKRSDLITDEDVKEYDRIHKKLTFVPSVDEKIIIQSHVQDKIEDATGEEATVEDIKEWFDRVIH